MKWFAILLGTSCWFATGCAKPRPCAPAGPNCHQYQAPGFDWALIRRIVMVPLANDSSYPHATFEMQETLASRMQCAGRFEVVLAAPSECITRRGSVRVNGRFDETEMLGLADVYNADAILFGTITQYQPYVPPQVGLALRLVRPADGAVFASIDGLWDARDQAVAEQARCYTMLTLNTETSLLGCDLAIDSPSVFRRFACHNAVEALVNPVQYSTINVSPIQTVSGVGLESPGMPAPSSAPPAAPFPPPLPPAPPDPPAPAASPAPDPQAVVPSLPPLPIELRFEPESVQDEHTSGSASDGQAA
jgi:hypothetical protein